MLNALISAASRHHDALEARAIAMAVLEDVGGLSRTDIYMARFDRIDDAQAARIAEICQRLSQGQPMQYAVGFADFGGRRFEVSPATLIPRPETELLVTLATDFVTERAIAAPHILDAGTGTGCIAVSLACNIADAQVEAWDISASALDVARRNAQHHKVDVSFVTHDILLHLPHSGVLRSASLGHYDLIVSNPPYVCQSERAEMASHVLDYEPATALFVPDDDALCFYHALLHLAVEALAPGGAVMMECNTAFVADVAACFAAKGYATACYNDCYDRPRFVVARSV